MRPTRRGDVLAHRCSAWGGGVVGTSAPEAALIGRDMFRAGGNAFDAAVAAALAETVLVPSKCGLAGDVVALVRPSGDAPQALTAIGPAPAGLAAQVSQRGLPVVGGLSVGVPAAPRGYAALAALGRFPVADLAAPAIALARQGFAWSPLNRYYTEVAAGVLREQNPDGVMYLPAGEPIETGAWVRTPGHAAALEEFVERGGDLFDGPLGDRIVDTAARSGGVLTHDDLAAARAQWSAPHRGRVGEHDCWVTPSPTHGPALLDALTDPRRHPGDPVDQVQRVRAVRKRYRDGAGDGGTSIVTAADDAGNLVVLVHSLSHPTFGSGLVVPGFDLVLGNRAGRGFTAEPGHPNFPHAGRRPITTLHAWALQAPDGPMVAGATSGGAQQMPWNLQTIERVVAGHDLAAAVLDPLWSLDPRTDRVSAEPGLAGVDADLVGALEQTSGIQLVHEAQNGVARVVSDLRSVGGVAAA